MKTPSAKTIRAVQKGKHRSLVQRLRTSTRKRDAAGNIWVSDCPTEKIADKLDAIGEALAYLIEKKKMKNKTRVRRQLEEAWLAGEKSGTRHPRGEGS